MPRSGYLWLVAVVVFSASQRTRERLSLLIVVLLSSRKNQMLPIPPEPAHERRQPDRCFCRLSAYQPAGKFAFHPRAGRGRHLRRHGHTKSRPTGKCENARAILTLAFRSRRSKCAPPPSRNFILCGLFWRQTLFMRLRKLNTGVGGAAPSVINL